MKEAALSPILLSSAMVLACSPTYSQVVNVMGMDYMMDTAICGTYNPPPGPPPNGMDCYRGSLTDNFALISSQPWWGDSTKADAFINALGPQPPAFDVFITDLSAGLGATGRKGSSLPPPPGFHINPYPYSTEAVTFVTAKKLEKANRQIKTITGGVIDDIFDMVIYYDPSSIANVNAGSYTNPGTVTPNPGSITSPAVLGPEYGTGPWVRSDANPLLASNPYNFRGYQIIDIQGTVSKPGMGVVATISYNKASNVTTSGVFNTCVETTVCTFPTDTIAHALPDNLFNPGEIGLGFYMTPSIPSWAVDNTFSIGGVGFDTLQLGSNHWEPYQVFTIAAPTSTVYGDPVVAGDFGGCPGSCKKATPGPMAIMGASAAFGFSRKLRQRIKLTRAD